jgi:flavin reductase (DIM6/NTAB) family NADH-FMN oxidoreductase RutF
MGHDDPAVSADDYKAVMRHWPSGVTVITMLDGAARHGMTASAFTSVSIHPPLVLVVVDKRWRSHGFIRDGGLFCVNILAADQRDVSDRFAGRHGELADRFADLPTATAHTGAPVLASAMAWLDCVVDHTFDAGDHTVFVGRVAACGVNRPDAEPLLYHDTRYRAFAPREP